MSGYHAATIVGRRLVSPTVMLLELELKAASKFQFKPGQWVDFIASGQKWVGGFSPASTPSDLPRLQLAIKKSNHPPSQWIHLSSKIGDQVQVQTGGSCVLNLRQLQHVIFVAGGIGVAPLWSLYQHWHQQVNGDTTTNTSSSKYQASVLYSVSTQDELVFGQEWAQLAAKSCRNHIQTDVTFTLTQQSQWEATAQNQLESLGVRCQVGRQLQPFLQRHCSVNNNNNNNNQQQFYICGPPTMMDEAIDLLLHTHGIAPSQIHYEKWW